MSAMKCKMEFIFLTFYILGLGSGAAVTCPDSSWISFNNNCYKFCSDDYRNFYDSEMVCRAYGGQLVHVTDKQENDFIKQKLRALQKGNFWMGLTDFLTENIWLYYANNQTVTYFDWYPGEPNNYMGQEEHCAAFYYQLGYQWVDTPCDIYLQPICEIEQSDGIGVVG